MWSCSSAGPFTDEHPLFGENLYHRGRSPDKYFLMQIGPVYAVISVVEANMVIRGYLGRPALHVFIRYRRKRHKFPSLLVPVVAAAVWLLGEGRIVEFIQMSPKVSVELLQAEVVHFLHVVEEAFFQNTNGILYRTLILGLPDLGRKNDRVVMLGPFCVILVQFWGDPVSVIMRDS